jgi:hypothetical protein
MGHLARSSWLFCTLLVGCASQHPKPPSYDDGTLRPINQDLVAWMNRLNIDHTPPAPPPPKPANSPAASDTGVPGSVPIGDPRANLKVSSTPAQPIAETVTTVTGNPESGGKTAAWGLPPPPAPWVASSGATTKATLLAWTTQAKWTLAWEAKSEGPVAPSLTVPGDFLTAVRALLKATQLPGKATLRVEAFTKQNIIHVTDKD